MSVTNNVAVLHFLKQRCVTWRHRTGSVVLMFLDTTVHRLGNSVALFCFASFSLERFPSVDDGARGRRELLGWSQSSWTVRDHMRARRRCVNDSHNSLKQSKHETLSVHAGLSLSHSLTHSLFLSLSLCDRSRWFRTDARFFRVPVGVAYGGSPWNRLQVFTLCDPILIAEIEFMYIFIFF